MIHGDIKKPLNLPCMEIDSDNTGHTRRCHEIRNKLCRDRLTPARLTILTRIGIVRDNRRNTVRGRTLARIRENQQLHEVVIHGKARRLDDEDVLAANALFDHHLDFTVVELPNECLAERYADTICDVLCQLGICVPRQDANVVGGKAHCSVPPKNQMRQL